MPETLAYTYTSQAEIERIMSPNMALDFLDHDQDGADDDDTWQDVINEATDTINMYAEVWYEAADLSNNVLVRRWASWIGAYLMSMNRGDPAMFIRRYDEVIARLEKILLGTLQIPRVPLRADMTPSMSNFAVDDRFRVNKVRVTPTNSVGGVSPTQDLDRQYPAGNDYG